MRARSARVLMLTALVVAVGFAATPPSNAGAEYRPQPGVGLEGLLESLVDGDSPLIREVESTAAFSPIRGDVEDTTGRATLTDVFHTSINVGAHPVSADLDFDGVTDLPAGALRLGGDDGDRMLDPVDTTLQADLLAFAAVFSGQSPLLFAGLGLDGDSPDVQDFGGTPIRLVGDMNWRIPDLDVVDVWGGHFATPLSADLSCGTDLFEFGQAFALPGGLRWETDTAVAERDLFAGASNAIVTRCRDGFWYVDALVNEGSFFQSYDTNTFTLVWPEGFASFTDRRETAPIVDYRMFAFRTPVVGGYTADTTYATTEPAYPAMRAPMLDYLVGTPFATEYGPFSLGLEFVPGADTSPDCPSGWSAAFEVYADMANPPGRYDSALYQFASGQISIGALTWNDDDQLQLTADGQGDGYTESYTIEGATGSYLYRPGDMECGYSLRYEGWDEIADTLRTAEIALGLRTETGETGQPEDPTEPAEPTPTGQPEGSGPTTGTPDTGTAAPADGSSGDDGPPWEWIATGLGALLILIGYGVSRTREESGPADASSAAPPTTPPPTTTPPTTTTPPPTASSAPPVAVGPCERLRRLLAEAKADAAAKQAAATEARAAADAARGGSDDAEAAARAAGQAADDAIRKRRQAERDRNRPPAGEDRAWIEDAETGERITGRDLRLRREAAGEAWDEYRGDPSEESARQTEENWRGLDDPGAREGRRATDDADQAARQQRLEEAQQAEERAAGAKTDAERTAHEASEAATEAENAAERAEAAAREAQARAETLQRQLDECLGMTGGPATRWGGPMGMGEDCDGGCFPEGNVERIVIDTFDRMVKVNHWVTVRPTSEARNEARRISGELRWWRDMFATTSSAINVAGALKGLVTRTPSDLVDTAVSGGSVVAGEELGIDIPTNIYQVPVVALEGAAAASAAIIDAFGRWIELNHVEWVAQWGYQVRDCKLTWVEIWKCENGVRTCAERVLEVDIGAPTFTGAVHTETYQPRENWQRRVDGLTRTHATRVQTDAQLLTDFMQKHRVGPCGG